MISQIHGCMAPMTLMLTHPLLYNRCTYLLVLLRNTIFNSRLFFKDADEVAKQIVEPGQPAFNEIKETFGQSVIDELTGKIVSSFF